MGDQKSASSHRDPEDAASVAADPDDARQVWERPALRRLGADPAISGGTADYYVYSA